MGFPKIIGTVWGSLYFLRLPIMKAILFIDPKPLKPSTPTPYKNDF